MERSSGLPLLYLGIGAAVIYLIYKNLIAPVGAAASTAYNATTNALAQGIVGLTHTPVVPNGSVLMPNGLTQPISNLQTQGFDSSGNLNMTDAAGNSYVITSLGGGAYQAN
jgi:hypothetical protein